MTERQTANGLYLVAGIVATYCEVYLWTHAWFPLALAGHLLISSGLLMLMVVRWREDKKLAFLGLMFLTTLLCGPFGSAASVAALVWMFVLPHMRTTTLQELLKMIFPEEDKDAARALFERVKFGMEEYDTEHLPVSYTDIMTYGSLRQKRIAIERLLKFFRPEFGEALLLGINDSSNSIRVLAATAIARINDKYNDTSNNLESRIRENPNQLGLLIEFARFCEEYAALAFLDKGRSRKLRERAIQSLEHYDGLHVDNHEVLLMLGRLHYRLGNYEEARNYLERLLIKEHVVVDEAYKWYLSILFLMKEYDALRLFVRRESLVIGGSSIDHDAIVDQVILWRRGVH